MTTRLPASPRVIEIGDVTAGIVMPGRDGTVRFFSAGRVSDGLYRRSFRKIDLAIEAVREILGRKGRPRHRAEARPERWIGAPTISSVAREGSSSQMIQARTAAPTAAHFLGFNHY